MTHWSSERQTTEPDVISGCHLYVNWFDDAPTWTPSYDLNPKMPIVDIEEFPNLSVFPYKGTKVCFMHIVSTNQKRCGIETTFWSWLNEGLLS